ncbi:hypothetical protein LCGC14_2478540, partial [marine sediment metagenome]
QTDYYKQLALTFNPISIHHHLKKRFFDKAHPNVRTHSSTYRDNRFLDEEYKAELEELRELDAGLALVYADGEWGDIKNIIYQHWEIVDFDWLQEKYEEEAFGLDWGFSKPTAVTHTGFRGETCDISELIYQTRLTDDDLITILEQTIPASKRQVPIYADPSQPGSIEALRRAGFVIRAAENNVVEGIRSVQRKRQRISQSSQNIVKEISGYKWRELRSGEVLDEPVKVNDHAMDSIRYPTYTIWLMDQDKINPADFQGASTGTSTDELNKVFSHAEDAQSPF